ncbi:DUF2892 domain-containing protein [Moraxella sp. ZY210820]|uniref:YgaP family membrane protein n=1 Tax=unclassified Moraxella TaxID=2685852 RepID=UPI0027317718|nr:DUF2892 domain-containing protein [Moraxella sp. ZY210820]WLF84766.1 DUF2892 domain-containing protein [Moraxella sp. ZY210820]
MKRNLGQIDKIVRIILGLVILALVFTQVIGWWGLIGLIPLVTGVINFCPLYHLLGINTCKVKLKDSE